MAKWGDLLEEEEELPQSTTTGPDAKGVVTKARNAATGTIWPIFLDNVLLHLMSVQGGGNAAVGCAAAPFCAAVAAHCPPRCRVCRPSGRFAHLVRTHPATLFTRSSTKTMQVEYYRNEKGEVMKKTTKTRVVKIEKKVYQVGGAAAAAAAAGAGRCSRRGCAVCRRGHAAAAGAGPPARWRPVTARRAGCFCCVGLTQPPTGSPCSPLASLPAGGPGPPCQLAQVWGGRQRACDRQRDQPDA